MAVMGLALVVGSVPLLAVAFVITGAGIGTLDVLINVEGAAVEQAAGRTLMPMMHAAWSIGAAIGSGIGAACAALGDHPRGTAHRRGRPHRGGRPSALAAGIPRGRARASRGSAPRDRAARLRQWLRGWLDVRLLLIGLVMLGVELGEGSANGWLTLAVQGNHGQTAAVAALFFTTFATAEGLTRIFAGPVVDRLGRVATIRLTTALGLIGIIAFILAGQPLDRPARRGALGGRRLHGLPARHVGGGGQRPGPGRRISVVASIGYFANLAGPPAIGALAESAGLLNALWLIAALFVAAFAAAGALRPRRSAPRPGARLTDQLARLTIYERNGCRRGYGRSRLGRLSGWPTWSPRSVRPTSSPRRCVPVGSRRTCWRTCGSGSPSTPRASPSPPGQGT